MDAPDSVAQKPARRDPEPEAYDPHLHRNIPHATNNFETLLHLLKGSIGSGILAMPQAFSRVGLTMGIVVTVILGIILTHCLQILIKSEYEACKRQRIPHVTYPMAIIILIKSGPKAFRPMANFLAILTDVFLIVYQLGICCVYMLFMADNLKKLLDPYFQLPLTVYMLIFLGPLILLNLIRDLKTLAPLSGLANAVIILSVVLILYVTASGKKGDGEVSQFGILAQYPLFFGTTMFALTSVGVVVATERNMKNPKSFSFIFNIGMVFVVILYTAVGLVGYIYCTTDCSDSITLDMPPGGVGVAVMALYIVAIFSSYALNCYVPVEILQRDYINPRLERNGVSERRKMIYDYTLRIGLCIGTFLVTLAVPRLGLFISLFGALCLSALGISFPALMELCAYYPDKYGPGKIRLWKDIALFFFGLIGLLAGTYTALYNIVISFQ